MKLNVAENYTLLFDILKLPSIRILAIALLTSQVKYGLWIYTFNIHRYPWRINTSMELARTPHFVDVVVCQNQFYVCFIYIKIGIRPGPYQIIYVYFPISI